MKNLLKLMSKSNKKSLSTSSERASDLLNSKVSFGRITTAEAKSVNYRKYKNISRSSK